MTPTISVPVDTLLNLAVLSKTAGENSKAEMGKIIKGILDENLNKVENEAVFR